jgi:aminopeptidase C
MQLTSDRAWSLDELSRHIDPQLDNNIYPLAKKVFMYGAIYTPLEFAHSVYHPAEYTFYTSFTHHPFGEPFVMESPDNHYHDAFLNIPIDTLMNKIVNSIRKGHPVCWEGDISEPYFNYSAGIAQLPHGRNVNQELRQEDFNNRETTDDHCMEIMGLAHDAHGNRYFIMKNSWGDRNPLKGFMYVSYDYVKLKTVAVAMKER